MTVAEQSSDVDLWHRRLGHLNAQQLSEIVQKNLATGIKLPTTSILSFCKGCIELKMQCKPFKQAKTKQSTQNLELVHSDICGPMQVESIGGHKHL